jgi:hypothetical protein
MKTKLTTFFALAAIAMALPAVAQAQFTYTNKNGVITITGYTRFGGAVTIPGTISGLPVTTIGDSAFSGRYDLTSVTIPGSVSTIGDYAFYGCGSLTSVTIPGSVTNVGNFAFYYCGSLTNVTIGNGVSTIGDCAFCGCFDLTSVTIPDSVTTIGDYAFFNCGNLTAFIVAAQNSHYSSMDGVLFNQNQTTLVEYPGGLSGSYTIPNGVTTIGDYAFYYCGSLTSVTIPGSVTNIGNSAFSECFDLTSVYFNGNAPGFGSSLFVLVAQVDMVVDFYYEIATVYYLPGTSGWSSTFGGVPAVMLLPPPTLAITPSGANVILTWPTNVAGFDYSGFTVQSTTNLADSNSWTTLTNLPVTVGSQSQVTDAISGPAKFYRLKR